MLIEYPNTPLLSHPDPREQDYNPLQFPPDNSLVNDNFQSFQLNSAPHQHHSSLQQPNPGNFYNSGGVQQPVETLPFLQNIRRNLPTINSPNQDQFNPRPSSNQMRENEIQIKPFINFNIRDTDPEQNQQENTAQHPYPFEPVQDMKNQEVQRPGPPFNFPGPPGPPGPIRYNRVPKRQGPVRPRRNFKPRRPLEGIKINFGFRPPIQRIPFNARNRLQEGPIRENELQETPPHSNPFYEDKNEDSFEAFYDDEFFKDPDFENFDFSDFEEFEVDGDPSVDVKNNSFHHQDSEQLLDNSSSGDQENPELDFDYNREGLEMYKKRQNLEQVSGENKYQRSDKDNDEDHDDNETDSKETPSEIDPFRQFSYEPSNDNDFEEFDKYFNDFGDNDKVQKMKEFFTAEHDDYYTDLNEKEKSLALNVITEPFDTSDLKLNEKVTID